MRSRGIGTAPIRHGEQLTAERGRLSTGLGVDDHGNPELRHYMRGWATAA